MIEKYSYGEYVIVYNGQIYNTSPIIFNEPIYLEKVELVAQYESV